MVYSVGKAIRQLNKGIDKIYFLSGDDYFLQRFFIKNLNKKFNIEQSPRQFNFEEDQDIKIFLEEISAILNVSNFVNPQVNNFNDCLDLAFLVSKPLPTAINRLLFFIIDDAREYFS